MSAHTPATLATQALSHASAANLHLDLLADEVQGYARQAGAEPGLSFPAGTAAQKLLEALFDVYDASSAIDAMQILVGHSGADGHLLEKAAGRVIKHAFRLAVIAKACRMLNDRQRHAARAVYSRLLTARGDADVEREAAAMCELSDLLDPTLRKAGKLLLAEVGHYAPKVEVLLGGAQ